MTYASRKRLGIVALLALTGVSGVPAQEPPLVLQEAMALVEQGDPEGAIAVLENLVAEPDAPDIATAALGALLLETGNAGRALDVLAPLAERDPPDPAALFNAGRAAEALGRFQDAASLYQRSIELEPRSPALRALGMMIGRLGQAGDAYEYLRQWTAMNPSDQDARLAAAWGAVALGRPPDAEALIEGLDPQNAQVKLLRGRILLLRDDPWGALAELQPLAENPPAHLARGIRSALATAYLLVGEADGAIQQLESLSPEDPELAGRLARAYYQAGRIRDAIATLAPFVEPLATTEPPADASTDLARELAYDYGRFLHSIEETERALPFLRLAADLDPNLAETFRALGQVLSALGRRDEAEVAVERYQELAAAPDDMQQGDLEDPTGREVRIALQRAGSGDADGALEVLAREQRRAPADPRPAIAASSVLLHAGRSPEALAAVERALVTAPGNPDGLYQRGVVLMAMRQLDEAESMFRQTLAAAPGHIAGLNDYAVLLMSQGRENEAAQHLRRVLELRPDDPLARRHLDQLQEDPSATSEDPDVDVQDLRRAVELDPDNAAAWAGLGNALLIERSFRAAEEPLRRAVELDPSSVETRIALASALWENNRPDDALLHAREATTLRPADPAPHRLLGAILLWRGEYIEAAESLERSAGLLDEPDAERLLELARAWEGAADAQPERAGELLQRAEAAYREATALAPEHSEAVYGFAQVLRRLGRADEAAAQMERYRALYDRDEQEAQRRGRPSEGDDTPP